jgi:hypothetical protein
MADPTLKLKIGTSVEAKEGMFGHVHQVILSPLQHHIVGMVLRANIFPPRDWVVPVEWITDSNEARIIVAISREEILQQPMFDPSSYLSIASEKWGYAMGEAIVQRIADITSVFQELENLYE